MAIYNKYTARNKVCWKVEGYLSVNPLTGKKKKFKKQGFATKKEAIQAFNNAKYQFDQGNYITNNSNFKFEQVYQEWFSNVYVDNVKESTANKTEQHFRLHILPAFGELFIKKITPSLIQKQINIWHKKFAMYKKLGSHTLNVFDYAFAHGYIKDNPRNKVILNKKKLDYDSQEKKRKYYTKEEVHTLLNYLKSSDSGQWFPFFRLLAYSGMRKGEALALTWKDIDFNNNRITVNKTLTCGKNNQLILSSTKTESCNRVIKMDTETMTILKKWKFEQSKLLLQLGFNCSKSDQLLFCKYSKNTWLNLAAPYNRLLTDTRLAEIPMLSVHAFRHTHCSLLFDAGFSMHEVKERLGHSDIQTTMNIYAHVTKEKEEKSLQKFADFMVS